MTKNSPSGLLGSRLRPEGPSSPGAAMYESRPPVPSDQLFIDPSAKKREPAHLDAEPAAGFLLAQSIQNRGFRARQEKYFPLPKPSVERNGPVPKEVASLQERQEEEERVYSAILEQAFGIVPHPDDAVPQGPILSLALQRDKETLYRLTNSFMALASGKHPPVFGATSLETARDRENGTSWITLKGRDAGRGHEKGRGIPRTVLGHKNGRLDLLDRKKRRTRIHQDIPEQNTGQLKKILPSLLRLTLAVSIIGIAIVLASGKGCSV